MKKKKRKYKPLEKNKTSIKKSKQMTQLKKTHKKNASKQHGISMHRARLFFYHDEGVGQALYAEAYRSVTHVAPLRLDDGVKVDVDDAVEISGHHLRHLRNKKNRKAHIHTRTYTQAHTSTVFVYT